MINIDAIDTATAKLLEQGTRVLNPCLLAETETMHAMRLLDLMDPPQGAVILDADCGVGQLAILMHTERPDLTFKLLNISAAQLAFCPDSMEKLHASYDAIPLDDESVDVVLFAFSLCHSDDWLVTLREAYRVLKPGGMVFIFDFGRARGDNIELTRQLHASAYRPADVMSVAKRAGLEVRDSMVDCFGHRPIVDQLTPLLDDPRLIEDLFPMTMRLWRMPFAAPIASAFARHEAIAFQFSGGRDSTAALFSLRDYWPRMNVYFLDTGEHFPETLAVIDEVEQLLGRPIIRINSSVAAVREEHGYASDVVPVDNTALGRLVSGRTVKIQGRYECCARTLMNPMHRQMLADGITLIIRGQRDEDYSKPPHRSGDAVAGVELLYPIQHWTTAEVDRYLSDNQLPRAAFYAGGMPHGSDCMECTAWWGEGRLAYMHKNHPEAAQRVVYKMNTLRAEIRRQLDQLES